MAREIEDPIIRRNVGEILGWLKDTLEKAKTMKKQYGLRDQRHHEQENCGWSSSHTISRVETVTADITISSPERRARETHGKASTWRKLRWSISGQRKTLELLNDLRGFINSLYEFVPVVADVESALFDAIQRHVDPISLQHTSLLLHTDLPPRTAPPFQRTVVRYRSVYRMTSRRVQQPRGGGSINR
ncbi:hypothetical protein BDD12DRAFT_524444 [Trichophaea hybrida]|nr:hypothetical protein BDD12DRAFT_524444 [Trichophaea hybrida]